MKYYKIVFDYQVVGVGTTHGETEPDLFGGKKGFSFMTIDKNEYEDLSKKIDERVRIDVKEAKRISRTRKLK